MFLVQWKFSFSFMYRDIGNGSCKAIIAFVRYAYLVIPPLNECIRNVVPRNRNTAPTVRIMCSRTGTLHSLLPPRTGSNARTRWRQPCRIAASMINRNYEAVRIYLFNHCVGLYQYLLPSLSLLLCFYFIRLVYSVSRILVSLSHRSRHIVPERSWSIRISQPGNIAPAAPGTDVANTPVCSVTQISWGVFIDPRFVEAPFSSQICVAEHLASSGHVTVSDIGAQINILQFHASCVDCKKTATELISLPRKYKDFRSYITFYQRVWRLLPSGGDSKTASNARVYFIFASWRNKTFCSLNAPQAWNLTFRKI